MYVLFYGVLVFLSFGKVYGLNFFGFVVMFICKWGENKIGYIKLCLK